MYEAKTKNQKSSKICDFCSVQQVVSQVGQDSPSIDGWYMIMSNDLDFTSQLYFQIIMNREMRRQQNKPMIFIFAHQQDMYDMFQFPCNSAQFKEMCGQK